MDIKGNYDAHLPLDPTSDNWGKGILPPSLQRPPDKDLSSRWNGQNNYGSWCLTVQNGPILWLARIVATLC